MNRFIYRSDRADSGVPHASGDEPENDLLQHRELPEFPTRVGMNRLRNRGPARDD